MSLNHLLSFAFQILHRVCSDAVSKASSVERVKLLNFLEKLKIFYQESLDGLKFAAKNFDFTQLTVMVEGHAGAEGLLAIIVKDILAQAPILLNLSIKEDKNIGVLPLVPYILAMKPQETGDVHLELIHFSHDSFEAPTSLSIPNPSNPLSSGNSSSYHSEKELLRGDLSGPSTQFESRDQKQVLSNLQTGHFVTSYNRVVSNITSGRVFPRNTSACLNRVAADQYMNEPFQAEHLELKIEDQKRIIEEVLHDLPRGDESDTVITVAASSPHISMIVDHSLTLKPGAELFTMVLGPTKPGWKPFGTTNTFEPGGDQILEANSPVANNTPQPPTVLGWPIYMQTAPGVKFLIKVPKVEITMNLASALRFILAHFQDLPQLKAYLESCK